MISLIANTNRFEVVKRRALINLRKKSGNYGKGKNE